MGLEEIQDGDKGCTGVGTRRLIGESGLSEENVLVAPSIQEVGLKSSFTRTYIALGDNGGLVASSFTPSEDIDISDIILVMSVSGVLGLTVTSVLTVIKEAGPNVCTTDEWLDFTDSAIEGAETDAVVMAVWFVHFDVLESTVSYFSELR